MKNYNFTLSQDFGKARLDKALSSLIPEISRVSIQKSIKAGQVRVNQVIISDPRARVKGNDEIEMQPALAASDLVDSRKVPMDLDIIYEDAELIIINKPAGLTVHPGTGSHDTTLVSGLLHRGQSLSDIGGAERPGIVHRLDKDTSGLMVVAKTNAAHLHLTEQLQNRTLTRKYKALAWGILKPLTGTIETNIGRSSTDWKKRSVQKIGGKIAITHYRTEQVFQGGLISLVECTLQTGRTHQIRVHLSHAGGSCVGDQTYGHNSRKIHSAPLELQGPLSQY